MRTPPAYTHSGANARKKPNRAFQLLLIGSSVSMLGSGISSIAYPMLTLYLTGSPLQAGWVACAAVAPRVIMYIPAGVLVDRWDPRRVLLLSESTRGAVVTAMALVVATTRPGIWLLICCPILEGTLEAFSTLAERCYVRSLVEPDQAPAAQARMEARTHVVILASRPLGLVLFWPAYYLPFVFDAATFAISVIAVFRINRISLTWKNVGLKYQELKSIIQAGWTSELQLRNNLWDALRWLLHERYAFSTIAISTSASLVFQALLMVTLADAHTQRVSPILIGMMLAGSGAGGAIGSMLMPPLLRRLGQHRWIRFQAWSWLAAFGVLALPQGHSHIVIGAMMGVLGLTGALGNIELNTYMAQTVSEGMLARATSIVRIMSFATCAIGSALGGLLAQDASQHIVWILFGMTAILPILSFLGGAPRVDSGRLTATPAASQGR